jgi:hypothetical protein
VHSIERNSLFRFVPVSYDEAAVDVDKIELAQCKGLAPKMLEYGQDFEISDRQGATGIADSRKVD